MQRLILKRSYLKNCTIGKVFYQGTQVLSSVELPYLSNEPYISCIPPGVYPIDKHISDHHKNAFYLTNLNLGVGRYEGESIRFGILAHIANFPRQLDGCMAFGMTEHPTYWGVARSKVAMKWLNKLFDDNPNEIWELEII